jgi:hypothetical protein
MHLRRLATLTTAVLALAAILYAGEEPKYSVYVSIETQPDGTAYVTLNGRKAIHLQKPNGTLSPSERAKIIGERLSLLLPKVTDPKEITSKDSGANAKLFVRGTLVAIATPEEAKARSMTASRLAAMWAENLRKLLLAPPLSVEPESLLIPLGETRTIAVKSYVPGEIKAEITDGSIIGADPTAKAGSLVVSGLAVGDAAIDVKCGSQKVSVPIKVRKYAAAIAGTARTAVTGHDPPSSLLIRAAREIVRSVVATEPGASIRRIDMPASVQVPLPGRTATIIAGIDTDGPDYIPAKLRAEVEIEHRVLPNAEAADIWFCNQPETVTKFQVLFTGKLTPSERSTRLLYHHYNDMPVTMGFVVDVINPATQPAELHVIEGVSSPMQDVVVVGYEAGKEFINSEKANVGRIITVPPSTRRVLVSQAVPHPKTASGIMELRQLSGEPLIVRLIAKPEAQRRSDDPTDADLTLNGFDAKRITYSDGVFPQPQKALEFNYIVGKPWAFIRLGKIPIKHLTLDKTLYGFGITYDVNVALENPTDIEQTVEMLFEATAGPAAGVFLIDGRYVEVKRLGPPNERLIASYRLRPGQKKNVEIRTIPLSGSAYPATIIIRAAK